MLSIGLERLLPTRKAAGVFAQDVNSTSYASPMPETVEEYMRYKDNVTSFVRGRNQRIDEWQNSVLS